MKRSITKLLFALSIVLAFAFNVSSQDVSSPCFVKMNDELYGFRPGGMSDNGRFMVCNSGTGVYKNFAVLWDTQMNVVTQLGTDCWAADVSDDGKIIVGEFDDKTFGGLTAGYYKDGKWNNVDNLAGIEPQKGGNGHIYSVSPDGKFFGGYTPLAKSEGVGGFLVGVVWDGSNGKVLHTFDIAGKKDYRASLRCMSDDGQRGAGWSTRVGDAYFHGIWIPCFWTSKNADPIADITGYGMGNFSGINNAGTIAVGNASNSLGHSEGIIMKDDGTIKKIGSDWACIAETGRIAGMGVYDESVGGLWVLDDFLKDLYGLSVTNSWYVTAISDNGEYMAVMTLYGSLGFGTALARVSGDVLPTKAGKITLMGGALGSVNVSWEVAKSNGYVPIGYNVYRNGVKITDKPVTKVLTYNDARPVVGKNSYQVTAVYKYTAESAELESEKNKEKSIEVIAENGCYSPKHLEGDVKYNRIVNLSWGNPFPTYSSKADGDEEQTVVKLQPNVLKMFTALSGAIHTTSDGESIYGCNMYGAFGKYSLDGEALGNIPVEFGMYRGITCDGKNIYSTDQGSVASLIVINADGTITRTAMEEGIRGLTRISYLPFLNNNKGGFEVGTFADDYAAGTSYYIGMDGQKLTGNGNLPQGKTIMGVTYYDGKIYVAEREKATTYDMKIYLYDASTNNATGEYIDVRDYATLKLGQYDQIWGVSTMMTSEGIPCLAVSVGMGFNNRLVFLELAPMEGLKGYNVWRNNIKITPEPITTTYFTEKIFDANDYEYAVTAVFENACESVKSDPVNITITPIGVVNEPKNITTEAVRNNIIVSWDAPKSSAIPKLVGYNIFRDGKQLNPDGECITELFYTDKDLAIGDYTYSVNAFYNNSGESEKIETTTKLLGFNPTLAPTDLTIAEESRGDISLTWKTPALGDYDIKTWYSGNIEDCIGISENGGILYVASKWDANDLSSVFNYTLSDIEFYAGNNLDYTFYIYADDKLVGEQTIKKAKAKDYNLMKLDKPITIEKGKSLMVSCKVTHGAGELPIGISANNTAIGKGDLTSIDGKNWVSVFESENFKATWAISIRLMPYTLEAPKSIEGVKMEVNTDKNHKIVGGVGMMRNAATAVFKNSEVVGYNVYKNDEKINTTVVNTESFKDAVDISKNNCYSVEALFTADRKSPKSQEVCTYGYCKTPTLTGEIKGGYPEFKMLAPTEIVVNDEIKYYNEDGANAIGLGTQDPYYTLLSLKPTDLQNYSGFKITKINAFIADNNCLVSLFAKQGDRIILNQVIKRSDIKQGLNEWTVTSDIKIDKSCGLLIGLKVAAPMNTFTVGTDNGPAINYKSNVLSLDEGVTCISLSEASYGKLIGNWNISLSLENELPLGEECIGYNIYRDNIKINEAVIVDGLYVDKTTESNRLYNYHATALWVTNCESDASNKIEIRGTIGVNDLSVANVRLYPNPAKDVLNVDGDVETVCFYNSIGQECCRQKAEGGRLSINVSSWVQGIYIIEITSTTGEVNREKVIIK